MVWRGLLEDPVGNSARMLPGVYPGFHCLLTSAGLRGWKARAGLDGSFGFRESPKLLPP